MTDTDRPRLSVCIASAQIEIAARVDRKVLEGLQLASRHVDRETLRDGAEVEHQRTAQRDGSLVVVEEHIAVTDPANILDAQTDDIPAAELRVEAFRFHAKTDRGIECSVALLRHRKREPHGFEQHRSDRNGHADLGREPCEFAPGIEAGAIVRDRVKPFDGALDTFFPLESLSVVRAMTDDLEGDDRSHQTGGMDVRVAHFALCSASTTA